MRRTILLLAVTLAALTAGSRSASAQVSGTPAAADSLSVALRAVGLGSDGVDFNGKYVRGNTTVAATDTIDGPLVVLTGTANIFGTVQGSVYSLWGDVVVHEGAQVNGGATAYRGRVILDGGRVNGAMTAWSARSPVAVADAVPMTRGRALQLAGGWTAMLIIIGILVLVIAATNMEATARILEQDFGRAFFLGVVGELGFLPLLLIATIALAITIVGVLLIPFVLVAAPIALAGMVTLGWLALALTMGRAVTRARAEGTSRAEALKALVFGVLLLMTPWIIAAALQGAGTAAAIARIVAIGIGWVGATAGLGASLLSRAGAGRRQPAERPMPPMQGWQTPTPVAGVAAARRPIPARPGATPQ
ncbi:MAG: hypothetical protein ACKVS7_17025 [Gemmatimonadaceae bacterium]